MKDFGYCVWYILESNHPWNSIIDFTPHITIKSNLTLNQAYMLYDSIIPRNIKFTISQKYISCEENFYAIYYSCIIENLSDSHISFGYNYYTVPDVATPNINTGVCDKVGLVKCKGHYKNWKILEIKKHTAK